MSTFLLADILCMIDSSSLSMLKQELDYTFFWMFNMLTGVSYGVLLLYYDSLIVLRLYPSLVLSALVIAYFF